MGLGDFFKVGRSPKREWFGTDDFSLMIPAGWKQQPESEPGCWVFRRDDGLLALTISAFNDLTPEFDVDDYLKVRLTREREMSPTTEWADPDICREPPVSTAFYCGTDPSTGRRVMSMVQQFDGVRLVQLYLESWASEKEYVEAWKEISVSFQLDCSRPAKDVG